jgi:hypothetical protein
MFCPTLFGHEPGDNDEIVGTLANRIRDFREQQAAAVETEMAAGAARDGVRFHYVDATASLIFTAEDIGADCFHLSTEGQAKVAEAVLEAMR